MTDSSVRFEELDALRGIAAISVVLFHYTGHANRYFDDFPFHLKYGEFGVQLFFVISGFVIYFTLKRSRRMMDFAFARLSRLYPAYWATLSLLLIVDLLDPERFVWWGGFLVNATLLQRTIGYPDIDIVFWTLAVEMTFYLVISVTFFFAGLERRIWIVIGIWLACANIWPHVVHIFPSRSAEWIQSLQVFPHSPYFLAGIAFYDVRGNGLRVRHLSVLVGCWLTLWHVSGETHAVASLLIFAAVLLAVMGRLSFIVNPVTLWLGAISYSLYLVHRNLGYMALFELNRLGIASAWGLLITVCGAVLLASAITYFVERPAMGLFRLWYRRVRVADSPSAGIS